MLDVAIYRLDDDVLPRDVGDWTKEGHVALAVFRHVADVVLLESNEQVLLEYFDESVELWSERDAQRLRHEGHHVDVHGSGRRIS